VVSEDYQSSNRAFICLSHSPFMTLPGASEAGPRYLEAVESAKKFIQVFVPDVVVIFAPDHMNLLNEVRPPFTGVLSGKTLPEFGIPELKLKVHSIAADLFQDLVGMDVDLAVGEDVSVDHGLGLTLTQLFDEPSEVPLIPVIVNAIGYPLPPVRRAQFIGKQFGAALHDRPERILFIGTGGLSHNPPFPEPAPGAKRLDPEQRRKSIATAMRYVDPVWDQELLSKMAAGDTSFFSELHQEEISRRGGGANEIRTWAAAWSAAGAAPATFTDYEVVEPWITGMGVTFGLGQPVK
jgi:2,3-dihydroxyphenylpropionate 1,2-dioxygenase